MDDLLPPDEVVPGQHVGARCCGPGDRGVGGGSGGGSGGRFGGDGGNAPAPPDNPIVIPGGGSGASSFTPSGTGLTSGVRANNGLVNITFGPAAGTCPATPVTAAPKLKG